MNEKNKNDSRLDYVGIKFCKECNNMLYPKEDVSNKRLLYACRNFGFSEPSKKSCVYVNNWIENYDELKCIDIIDVIKISYKIQHFLDPIATFVQSVETKRRYSFNLTI